MRTFPVGSANPAPSNSKRSLPTPPFGGGANRGAEREGNLPKTHSLGMEEPGLADRLLAKPSRRGFAPGTALCLQRHPPVNPAKSWGSKAQGGTSQPPRPQPPLQNSQGVFSLPPVSSPSPQTLTGCLLCARREAGRWGAVSKPEVGFAQADLHAEKGDR